MQTTKHISLLQYNSDGIIEKVIGDPPTDTNIGHLQSADALIQSLKSGVISLATIPDDLLAFFSNITNTIADAVCYIQQDYHPDIRGLTSLFVQNISINIMAASQDDNLVGYSKRHRQ